MTSAPNRFDFLRLVFASVVFAYHGVALPALDPGGQWEFVLGQAAEVSIQGFFVVSGALVFGSLERSKSLLDYGAKRVRRLYPAYIVVVLVPALIALVLSAGVAGNLQQIARYVGANLVFLNFLEPTLPGLFTEHRFGAVNGALWTLKIEVMFYLVLPFIGWVLARLGRNWWLGIVALYVMALSWQAVIGAMDHPRSAELARQLPGQMAFFASGMALWKLWDKARDHPYLLGVLGVVLLALSVFFVELEPLRALGLAGLIGCIAFAPGPVLNAARWGDVSYGVYITHFPVLQAFIAFGLFTMLGPIGGLFLAGLVVFSISYVLWWGVEKPALRRDSHYRKATDQGGDDVRIRDNRD